MVHTMRFCVHRNKKCILTLLVSLILSSHISDVNIREFFISIYIDISRENIDNVLIFFKIWKMGDKAYGYSYRDAKINVVIIS